MKAVLMLDGLKPVEKLILLKIAERADGDGANAWPSYSTLARAAGCCDRRRARRVVDVLITAGWLTKDSGRGRGRYQTNTYHLDLNRVFLASMGAQGPPLDGVNDASMGAQGPLLSETQRPSNGGPGALPLGVQVPPPGGPGAPRSSLDLPVDQIQEESALRAALKAAPPRRAGQLGDPSLRTTRKEEGRSYAVPTDQPEPQPAPASRDRTRTPDPDDAATTRAALTRDQTSTIARGEEETAPDPPLHWKLEQIAHETLDAVGVRALPAVLEQEFLRRTAAHGLGVDHDTGLILFTVREQRRHTVRRT
jgi:hypothetical protein